MEKFMGKVIRFWLEINGGVARGNFNFSAPAASA
jgi:hypothetical protein